MSEEAAWFLCFWLFKVAVNYALRNKMHSILKKNKRYPQGGEEFLCCNKFRMRAEQQESRDDEMLVGGCRHSNENIWRNMCGDKLLGLHNRHIVVGLSKVSDRWLMNTTDLGFSYCNQVISCLDKASKRLLDPRKLWKKKKSLVKKWTPPSGTY